MNGAIGIDLLIDCNSFKLNSINQLNNEDCTAFYMNYFDNMDGNHEIIEGRYGWSLWGNRHMFKRDDWKTIDFSNINDNAIKFLSNYHDLMTVTSLDDTYYFGYLKNHVLASSFESKKS